MPSFHKVSFVWFLRLQNSRMARWPMGRHACCYVRIVVYCYLLFHFRCMAVLPAFIPCVCLMPTETRRRHWKPWNWSYRYLWATMWVPATQSWSWTRTFNHWATSPSWRFNIFWGKINSIILSVILIQFKNLGYYNNTMIILIIFYLQNSSICCEFHHC